MAAAYPPLEQVRKALRVKWYRCPIEPAKLRELTRRSDLKGMLYPLGHLGLLVVTGLLVHYFFEARIWLGLALSLFAHGTIFSVSSSGNHELSHGTVFKTKWLNGLLLRIYGLLTWFNFHQYKMSHTYHHLYTLYPDGDREVVLPRIYPLKILRLVQLFTFDFVLFFKISIESIRAAITGKFSDEWVDAIFTTDQTAVRRQAINWERFLLLFHASVIAVSIVLKLWMLPVVITFGRFFANWWIFFIAGTMHAGLRDNVSDFRLNCRTIKLDPFSQYLRWSMNFHIEHHMFAAVPCYNLAKLYRVVASDMPKRRSLLEAWREMRGAERRQKTDPSYQFDTPLPEDSGAGTEQDPLGAAIGDIKPKRFVD